MNLAEEVSSLLYWFMVESTTQVSSSVEICPAVMQLDSSITEVPSHVLSLEPVNSCLVTCCYRYLTQESRFLYLLVTLVFSFCTCSKQGFQIFLMYKVASGEQLQWCC